jgi:hypothetical protein
MVRAGLSVRVARFLLYRGEAIGEVMSEDVVVVFTGESLERMRSEGGSARWRASKERLLRCSWILAMRNCRAEWCAKDVEHGTAFLIGRITGIRSSEKRPGRYVIEFDAYAAIDLKYVWPGNQNPVTYSSLVDLKIRPEALQFKSLQTGNF